MKVFLIVLAFLGVTTGLAVVGSALNLITIPWLRFDSKVNMERDLVKKVYNTDNALYNSHWFQERAGSIKALESNIVIADNAAKEFDTAAGPRKDWTFEDKTESARLHAVAQGLKSERNSQIEEYNARASEADRAVFVDGIPTFFQLYKESMKKISLIAGLIVASLVFSGCESTTTSTASTYKAESQKVEQAQQKMNVAVPIPQIETSQERANVARRATIFNTENKVSYIYLVNYGKVMAFYSVKGKVSSLRSYMVPTEKLVDGDGNQCKDYWSTNAGYKPCYAVSSSDIDGTYGENVEGIFFFTTEGAYVEWKGDYMMSDQPLKLTTQPELVREIK